jgi:hypothetical protein
LQDVAKGNAVVPHRLEDWQEMVSANGVQMIDCVVD